MLCLPVAVLVKLLFRVTLAVALGLLLIYKVQSSSLNLSINESTDGTGEKLLGLSVAVWLSYQIVSNP